MKPSLTGIALSQIMASSVVFVASSLVAVTLCGCGPSETPLTPEEMKSSRNYKLANDRIENAPKAQPGKKVAKPR